jgi:lipoprotein-releasing system permease protein
LGAGENAVRLVFVWDGFIIGLAGAGSGLILGLLIAGNIAPLFAGLEFMVNRFIDLLNLAGSGADADFAIFSPTVFYLKEIPSRPILSEVFLIFLFGFLSALAASWTASAKVSQAKPADILRCE